MRNDPNEKLSDLIFMLQCSKVNEFLFSENTENSNNPCAKTGMYIFEKQFASFWVAV